MHTYLFARVNLFSWIAAFLTICTRPVPAQQAPPIGVDLQMITMAPEIIPTIFPAGLAATNEVDAAAMQRLTAAINAKRAVVALRLNRDVTLGKPEALEVNKVNVRNNGGNVHTTGIFATVDCSAALATGENIIKVNLGRSEDGGISGPVPPAANGEHYFRTKSLKRRFVIVPGSHTLLGVLPPTMNDGTKDITLGIVSFAGTPPPPATPPKDSMRARETPSVYAEIYQFPNPTTAQRAMAGGGPPAIARVRSNRNGYIGAIKLRGGISDPKLGDKAESYVSFGMPEAEGGLVYQNTGLFIKIDEKECYLRCCRLAAPYSEDDFKRAQESRPKNKNQKDKEAFDAKRFRLFLDRVKRLPLPLGSGTSVAVLEAQNLHLDPNGPVIVSVITVSSP